MVASLATCLKGALLSRSQILHGIDLSKKPVEGIHVLTDFSVQALPTKEEFFHRLVISDSWKPFIDEQGRREWFRALVKNQVAGLVLLEKPHNFMETERMMSEIAGIAKEEGLPLLFISEKKGVSLSALVEELSEIVLYYRSQETTSPLIHGTLEYLLDFERHATFAQALKTAALKNDFQVILFSPGFHPVFAVETRHRMTIEAVTELVQPAQIPDSGNLYYHHAGGEIFPYWSRISLDRKSYYLLLVDNENSYSTVAMTQLGQIIQLAMKMWNFTPQKDPRAEYIKALSRSNIKVAAEIQREMGLESKTPVSVFYGRGLGEKEQALLSGVHEPEILLMKMGEDTEVLGVIMAQRDEAQRFNEWISQKFDQIRKTEQGEIYHVTGIQGLEKAGEGYELIGRTREVAENIFTQERIFDREQLTLIATCMELFQNKQLKEIALDLLAPLFQMPSAKAKAWIRTLETFVLDGDMGVVPTAQLLGIHPNTVQYRIKAMGGLLGIDIHRGTVAGNLIIATILNRLNRLEE